MTDLLLKLFVKDHKNTDSPAVRTKIGKFAGIVGIICNILLFAGKLTVGIVSASVSVTADAINNLADASSSVVTLLGFRMAQQPADRDHPYGHARYEYLSGLAVAALILVIGTSLASSSIGKILEPVSVEFSTLSFIIIGISIAVKAWMSLFFRKLGRKIDSGTLRATSADSRNDVVASSAVLVGCLIEHFFDINVDGWIGLAVAIFILYSGIGIAKDTVSPLLGKRADPELTAKLTVLVSSHEKILGVHDLLIHDYGPGQCYASLHAEISADEDPILCHDVIDTIERSALSELNVNLVIHHDPVIKNNLEQNEARELLNSIITSIDPALSMHDFRIVKGEGQNKLIFDLAVPYSMTHRRKEFKKKIDEALAQNGKGYAAEVHFDGKE